MFKFAKFIGNQYLPARPKLPRKLATKAQKYRAMAANMADPVDTQIILDFAEKLEELSKCECDISDLLSIHGLNPDRERIRYILNRFYPTPNASPLILEIMYSVVIQKL
jgi:hypothetical protein